MPVTKAEKPILRSLHEIRDPIERATACQAFIVNGRDTIRSAERLRDEAIVAARKAGAGTIDHIASQVKVKRNVVVDALRGLS